MSDPTPFAVVCTGLCFAWPDGTPVLTDLDVAFGVGRTALLGRNGSGKSTLLRLVAGDLQPSHGTVVTTGDASYLAQGLARERQRTVAELLGVAERRNALLAIEAGDADPAHFAALAEDWDVEQRARSALDRVGLSLGGQAVLDRRVDTLSGGEVVLGRLAGLLLRGAPITLLDEPSNDLDRDARSRLYRIVEQWPGVLVIATHDRQLLERVDQVVELRDGSARTFTGPYSSYASAIEAEQDAAEQAVRAAEGKVARERRQLADAQTQLARRARYGDRASRDKRDSRIKMNAMKRSAQVSAGRHREIARDRLADAQAELAGAELRVRAEQHIRVELPLTAVPAGRVVLRLGELVIRGPERIALSGANGSGKTTLLRALAGRRPHPRAGVPRPEVPTGYLPQRLDLLEDHRSVLDNVRATAGSASGQQVRALLAHFGFRGDRVAQSAGSLSGGERLCVSLACLLLAEPAPQLLMLDEPTNNLDLDGVERLVGALRDYRGALLVVSHDDRFLAELGVTRHWEVSALALPREVQG